MAEVTSSNLVTPTIYPFSLSGLLADRIPHRNPRVSIGHTRGTVTEIQMAAHRKYGDNRQVQIRREDHPPFLTASNFKPEMTQRDVFDDIEMFYNPKCKHARNGMLSPVKLERQQKQNTSCLGN